MDQHDPAHPSFFGYGSLVNLATHSYPNARKAQARGWARAWLCTSERDFAFLSAVPRQGGEIDGLIADVPNGDWAALDRREDGYDRVDLDAQTAIYAIPPHSSHPASARHPILLSYLDVVIQGYLTHFAEAGALRFFETTGGWTTPVLDDRAAPLYPRAQILTARETALVDNALATLGTPRIPLQEANAR